MFFDRAAELKALQDHHKAASKRSQLLVIYGRRRVGKTTLVKEFLKDVKGVYIFIEPKNEELILKDCERVFGKAMGYMPRLDSWETLFDIALAEKLTLVFDEFQNLGVVNPHLFSKMQKIWDEIDSKPGLFFIAIGSYVGMIKKIFRDGKQPLFGRASGMMKLDPFDVFATTQFLIEQNLTFEECMRVYAVFGGVPRYLVEVVAKKNNIWDLFFSPTSYLREEGVNILSLEFGSQHKGYFSVLESISKGKSTPKEIADHAGMNIATVSKYLGELSDEYEMVKADRPATTTKKRFVRYHIKDNFFDFWFKYVHSNASFIEIDPKAVWEETKRQLPAFTGLNMEDVVKEIMITKRPFFSPTKLGRWWDRRGEEIDIVAVDEKSSKILFIEVKWVSRQVGWTVVEELKRKSKLVQWRAESRKEAFLTVSQKGFTKNCLRRMESEGIHHWDINDLKKLILD
ncbi:MAG: ATP-binding protein [Methanomassiliicoccales archaeon]|nr:MAG: ATP-binding protein [Methanomassiliicoccales archaeon]